MRLPDVNVLVGAHREEAALHEELRAWLGDALAGPEPLAMADGVLCSFLRITTHARIYKTPTPRATAMDFATRLRSAPGTAKPAVGCNGGLGGGSGRQTPLTSQPLEIPEGPTAPPS